MPRRTRHPLKTKPWRTISNPGAAAAAVLFCLAAALTAAEEGYVSPKLCTGCHAAIYKTYRNTGMAKSFARPRPENTIEDYTKNTSFYHALSNTYFEMLQRDGSYYQRRYQLGYGGKPTNTDETKIDYILGSGINARAYLHRNPDGGLSQLPLIWYSEKGGHWGMAPGYDNPGHIFGQRPITYDCLFCHNAYGAIPANHARLGDEPVFSGDLPEGIDCQRCHGPGKNHIEVVTKPGAKPEEARKAIVNPARLSPEREAEVCYQCHLQTTGFSLPHAIKRYDRGDFSYRPGQPLADFQIAFDFAAGSGREDWFQNVSTATRLRMSQCFLKSEQANKPLTCATCHDPHNIQHGKEAADHYNGVCRTCHTTAFTALVAAKKHTAEAGCVACHMPARRPLEVVHIVKTDHYIRRQGAVGSLAEIREHHETQANRYRGKVQLYYPKTLPENAENQMYLAIAQVRDRSNLEQGIPDLVRALEAAKPARPEPWFELGSAYLAIGQADRAIAAYRESLRIDPSYSASLLGLGAAFRQSGQLAQAAESYQQATQAAPDNPKTWNELGQVNLDLDRIPQALTAFKQSISLAPQVPQPHNGLGIVLAQGGDFPAAEKELREAIRILPNYGEAHGNLAGVLDLEHDVPQALFEFDLAVRLAPDDPSTRFNYGALLAREKRIDDARAQMEAAVKANPNFAEAHEMLGRLYEQKQQLDNALREYEAAVRIRPDMSQAQLDLGAVLANRGDIARAIEHLTQASNSPDPTLRRIALQLLEELKSRLK